MFLKAFLSSLAEKSRPQRQRNARRMYDVRDSDTSCRFRLAEKLEDRTLLAAFTVDTASDTIDANPGDGLAQDAAGNTSLRAAVMEANALAGDDTIDVPTGTYTLLLSGRGEDGGLTGDLDITDVTGSLTIVGSGPVSIRSTVDRMFDIRPGAALNLDNLELRGAREMSRSSGGAIRNDGSLDILNSRIEDNEAEAGGGIDNSGLLTITDSVLTNNHSRLSFIGGGSIQNQATGDTTLTRTEVSSSSAQIGAGIYEDGGTLTVIDSTIHSNTSPSSAGAGIYSRGSVTVIGSTIRDNDGFAGGGGIYANGNLTVRNSTFSGNMTANGVGGAIRASADVDISNTTIVNNSALLAGGGFYQGNSSSTVTFTSTIIAGNFDLNGADAFGDNPDVRGNALTSGGDNVFGILNDATGLADGVNGDQAGTLTTPLDAGLDILADNGGPTWTHRILPGSPALDRGSNPLGLLTDQRGLARTFGAATDVGAFEVGSDVLGDFVWHDLNGDGLQNAGEPGVGGAVAELFDSIDGTIGNGNDVARGTVITDVDGSYAFSGVTTGEYYIAFRPPVGFSFTLQDQAGGDDADSDADPATGRTALFTVTSGLGIDSIDAGLIGALPGFGFAMAAGGTAPVDNLVGRHAIADAVGNVYFAGDFQGDADFDPGPGDTQSTSFAGGRSFFLAKYTPVGALVWSRTFGGGPSSPNARFLNALQRDSQGNIVVSGEFGGSGDFDPGPSVTNLTSAGQNDAFVASFDENGQLRWAHAFGSTGFDDASDIAVDRADNVYVTGSFQQTVDFDPDAVGTSNLTAPGVFAVYVQKLDANGNLQWATTTDGGSTGWASGFTIAVDPLDSVIIGGMASNGATDFDPGTGVDVLTPTTANDGFLWKLNSTGTHVWARLFEGEGVVDDVAVDADGSVVSTGRFRNSVDFDPGPGTDVASSAGLTDIFLAKLDINGNYVWASSFGSSVDDFSGSVAIDRSRGLIYTTGSFQQTVDFDPGPGTVNLTDSSFPGGFLSVLDRDGNFEDVIGFTAPLSQYALTVELDPSGAPLVTGYFQGTVDFDPGVGVFNVTNNAGQSGFLARLDIAPAVPDTANPFVRLAPLGSLMSESRGNIGQLLDALDTDSVTFFAETSESIAAFALPDNPLAILTLQVTGFAGTFSSPAPGEPVILPPHVLPADQVHEIVVTSDLATTYTLDLTRNASIEEQIGVTTDTGDGNELPIDPLIPNVIGFSDPSIPIGTSRVFAVTSDGSNTIAEIDPVTGLELNRFPAPIGNLTGPEGIAFDGQHIFFVSTAANHLVYELDPDTGAVIDSDPLNGSGSYDGVAVIGGSVYIQDYGVSAIIEFDPVSDNVVRTTPVTDFAAIGGLAAIAAPTRLIMTTSSGDVHEVNPITGRSVSSFSPGFGFQTGVAVINGEIYLGNLNDNKVRVYSRAGVLQRTLDFPGTTSAISGGNNLLVDIDEYTIDLSVNSSVPLDVILAGQDGGDFSAATLEILDTDGITVLATGAADPLGVDAENFDTGIFDFVAPGPGIYTIRMTSEERARYGLIVRQGTAFESESNNDAATDPLRNITSGSASSSATGYLDAADGDPDIFLIDLPSGQPVVVSTTTLFDDFSGRPLNDLDPELIIVHPDGSTILTSDLNSLDGKNAIAKFVTPVAGSYQIRILASAGRGEYALEALLVDAPDLRATAFDAVSDHLPDGQTDVTFTVVNDGNIPAGAFDTHVVWSPNDIVGDADDVVVSGSQDSFPLGLPAYGVVSRTISLQLDKAALYAHALAATVGGGRSGTPSLESSNLFLVIDINNNVDELIETNNSGQGHLVDSDDITYFPWDKNADGVITPLEALSSIHSISGSDATSDYNGDGIVTPLEALSAIQRIGYIRNDSVVGDAPAIAFSVAAAEPDRQFASMSPAFSSPSLADSPPTPTVNREAAVPEASAETVVYPYAPEPRAAHRTTVPETATFFGFASSAEEESNDLFAVQAEESDRAPVPLPTNEWIETDKEFATAIDWLSAI